jgi:hypothetical protein
VQRQALTGVGARRFAVVQKNQTARDRARRATARSGASLNGKEGVESRAGVGDDDLPFFSGAPTFGHTTVEYNGVPYN